MDPAGPLQDALEQAREEYPDLQVDEELFSRHLESLGNGQVPSHTAELYLCWAACHGDVRAQTLLDQRFVAPVRDAIARFDSSDDFVTECLQLLRGRLYAAPEPRLRSYAGRGPLGGWMRVAATRVAMDQIRWRRRRRERGEGELRVMAAAESSLDNRALGSRYARAFENALRTAFQTLTARQRNVLRLHFVQGLDAESIGVIYGRDRSNVYRWLRTFRDGVRSEFRRHLEGELGALAESEFKSLVHMVEPRLDVSLAGLLEGASDADSAPTQ